VPAQYLERTTCRGKKGEKGSIYKKREEGLPEPSQREELDFASAQSGLNNPRKETTERKEEKKRSHKEEDIRGGTALTPIRQARAKSSRKMKVLIRL